jgi:hypothetical protein
MLEFFYQFSYTPIAIQRHFVFKQSDENPNNQEISRKSFMDLE